MPLVARRPLAQSPTLKPWARRNNDSWPHRHWRPLSWRGPVRHGPLRAFGERSRGRGVGLLGVLTEATRAGGGEFHQELGADWPLSKENRQAVVDFGVRGPPETYVVDAQGLIVDKITGRVGPGELEAIIDAVSRPAPAR